MRYFTAILILLAAPAWAAAEVSPLVGLSDAEQSYHEQVFDYTMDNIQPGDKFDWASYSGKGSISVGKPFVSKSGAHCRDYTEKFTVQEQKGEVKGISCKRAGSDGWCKLKIGDALTCAMEKPAYNLNTPSVNAPNANVNINVGGVGSVGTPNVNTNVNTNVNSPMPADRKSDGKGDPTAQGYADAVTGNAGKAAGSFSGSAIQWFNNMFR